jgi:hypothetical protein
MEKSLIFSLYLSRLDLIRNREILFIFDKGGGGDYNIGVCLEQLIESFHATT